MRRLLVLGAVLATAAVTATSAWAYGPGWETG